MSNVRLGMKRLDKVSLRLILFCLITPGVLAYYNDVNEYEISLLPRYLQVKVKSFLGMKDDEVIRETNRYGEEIGKDAYSPLHHYGLGLIYLRRAQTRLKYPKRQFDLDSAIQEFTFVIEHSPKESFILYEVYFKRGETNLLKNEISSAVKDFNKSISLKPAFFNAYIRLSECYKRIGDVESAEAILETGRSRAAKMKK